MSSRSNEGIRDHLIFSAFVRTARFFRIVKEGVIMPRVIQDEDYMNFLPTKLQQRRYLRWKEKMLNNIDGIIAALESNTIDDVMQEWDLVPKDVALIVRLGFVTDEQANRFDLRRIEERVP